MALRLARFAREITIGVEEALDVLAALVQVTDVLERRSMFEAAMLLADAQVIVQDKLLAR